METLARLEATIADRRRAEVMAELDRREGVSGLEEKANRSR